MDRLTGETKVLSTSTMLPKDVSHQAVKVYEDELKGDGRETGPCYRLAWDRPALLQTGPVTDQSQDRPALLQTGLGQTGLRFTRSVCSSISSVYLLKHPSETRGSSGSFTPNSENQTLIQLSFIFSNPG